MKHTHLLILLLMLMWAAGNDVSAQPAQTNTDRIRQLREEIAKRRSPDVPADLIDLNRSILIERCAQLRTLLKVEIDSLGRHRNLMGSMLTPEEAAKVNELLQSYAAETDSLANDIAKNLEADRPAVSPAATLKTTTKESQPLVTAAGKPPSPAAAPGASGSTIAGGATKSIGVTSANSDAKLDVLPPLPPATTDTNAPLDCTGDWEIRKTFSEMDKIICGLARDIPDDRKKNNRTRNQITLTNDVQFELLKLIIAKRSTPKFLTEAEDVRLDKQITSGAPNDGGSSLVVKGGVPTILGFAVENGGLTRNVSGSSITFRGNPVGLYNAFANRGFVTSTKADDNDPIVSFLKKSSFAFTFNTDRGPEPGVFTGTKEQLSSFSTRFEFVNKRRPRLYLKDWENFLADQAQHLADVINTTHVEIFDISDPSGQKWIDPKLQIWFENTQKQISDAPDGRVSAVLQQRMEQLPLNELSPRTIQALDQIERALGLYMGGRDDVLNKINRGAVVTFEYLNKREVNAPDTSHFTFIAEKGTGGGKVDFTLNGSLTMFNSLDTLRSFIKLNPTLPPARRLRDFQFSGQIDVPFGKPTEFGNLVLFAGGKYERLLQDASTDLGNILPNTKGDIGYLQAGIKVPIKGTGFKIPFSVTVANRSELVKEKEVRGNFGFTLDLDTFFAKFKPF